MLRTIDGLDRRVRSGILSAGVVLAAGLAGYGGSMIALGSQATPAAAPSGTVQTLPTGTAVAPPSSARPTRATTTPPTAPPPAAAPAADDGSPSPARRGPGAATHPGTPRHPATPVARPGRPDIVFITPYRDEDNGQWYYRVGLLGFPPDTVVEISGFDVHGNVRVAPLGMTTTTGAWNPFTTGFQMHFPYGGTCSTADPTTVTARGAGFSVTETVPRPVECDGGTTPTGPWTPPTMPTPAPLPSPPASP